MKKAAFHSAGRLDIDMLLNRFRQQVFEFTAGGIAFDITSFTWNLNIKKNVGANPNLLSLSLGSGLAFSPYEENILVATFQGSQVTPTLMGGEGPKYWELVKTDTNEIWISGVATFKYGLMDSGGADQEVTINLLNTSVSVELQAIVQVNGGGSGGGGSSFEIEDYTGFEAGGGTFPSPVLNHPYRLVFSNPNNSVIVDGVQYLHNTIIVYVGSGNWVSWYANYGADS